MAVPFTPSAATKRRIQAAKKGPLAYWQLQAHAVPETTIKPRPKKK